MKHTNGEVVVGLLIGLAVGVAMFMVAAGKYAQDKADMTGRETHIMEYAEDKPAASALTVVGPAAAGAGVGWLLDNIGSGDKASRDNTVNIEAYEGSVNVTIAGDNQEETTTTDNSTEN